MGVPIPPIPNETITEILTYLGKNDLLKCRLVSQSWNQLSLKILRNPKLEHEQELTQDNIEKFIEFFKERQEEWVLPFHLNFKREDEDEYEETVDLGQIPKYIKQLQTIFGETCVVGLTLTHEYGSSMESVEELISMLTLIAPSLNHLDLSEFNVTYHGKEEKMMVEDMLEDTQLSFPNLSKLKSCPAPDLLRRNHHSEQNEKNNKINSFLIEKSQNLKDLEVFSQYAILPIEQIGNLRKLKIVEELDDFFSLLKPIRICPTPILKDLSLFCSSRLSVLDHQILYDFLLSFSTSLQSLSLRFEDIPTNSFPRLSQLRFLSIQVSHSMPSRARRHVNAEKLDLNSEAFPVLESMDISANVYLESGEAESGSTKDDWSLGTVKNLRLKVMNSSFNANAWDMDRVNYCQDPENPDSPFQYEDAIISRPSAKEYVNQLQKLFPNVTSLTLVNESDEDKDMDGENEEDLTELLTAFIQSDGAPRIQELEIQGYEKNYLGYILNGLKPDREPRVIIENVRLDKEFLKSVRKLLQGFSGGSGLMVDKQMEFRDGVENSVITCKAPVIELKMTGLEKIRMSLMKKLKPEARQLGSEQETNRKDLYLMSLPKHFLLLRQINISQRVFGNDKDFCKQQIISVQEKFQNLVINTTD